MQSVPRVLSPIEIEQWGLPGLIPIFPSEEVIAIEAKWSKKDLQRMAEDYYLEPVGDKEVLVLKLLYVGALDESGEVTGLPRKELSHAPYLIGNPKKFCCSLCELCAPEHLLQKGQFPDRIAWLREHYKANHPGKWGK